MVSAPIKKADATYLPCGSPAELACAEGFSSFCNRSLMTETFRAHPSNPSQPAASSTATRDTTSSMDTVTPATATITLKELRKIRLMG